MTDDDRPIEPTRIIPPGEPLPEVDGPPGPGDLPPWREPAAPPHPEPPPGIQPAPPAADSTPTAEERQPRERPAHEVGGVPWGQTVVILPPSADEPAGSWRRLTGRIRPGHTLAAAALALTPTWTGYSAAATWQSCVWYAHEQNLAAGYALAAAAVLVAYRAERRTATYGLLRAVVVRAWTMCALIGLTGALDLWDPIQILTGVPQ